MPRKKRIGVCVTGYGMGKFHCEGLRRLDEFELVGVCEIDKAKREQAMKEQGVKGYRKLEEALDDKKVDLVVLATPHDTHAPLAVQAMDAGKHVVSEKVMCTTVKEADAMIAGRDRNKVLLSVFQNRRWDSDFLTIKKIVESGWLGQAFEFHSAVGGYGAPGGWRAVRKHGGGMIYDWGAHLIDQALQLVKAKVSWVFADFQYRHWDTDVETHSLTLIKFDDDTLFRVELSNLERLPTPRWRVIGTEGTAVKQSFDANERAKVKTSLNGIVAEMEVETVRGDWMDFYRNIAGALLRGEELIVKPEQTMEVVRVIEAAVRSAERGQLVPLGHR